MRHMDQARTRLAPLTVAIVILILPALYVGSYLLLVTPQGINRQRSGRQPLIFPVGYSQHYTEYYLDHYRLGGNWAERFYYPLESIDRRIRQWNELILIPAEEIEIITEEERP